MSGKASPRPRKGTRVPAEKNKRRGAKRAIEEVVTTTTDPVTAVLMSSLPADNREFVALQVRRLGALADELALKRKKAAQDGRTLSPAELQDLLAEARLRQWAGKLALGNRDPINDLGIDAIETGIAEGPWREPEKDD